VAVEKLAHQEFAEIASRQEALQTIFLRRLDIFYHPFSEVFQKTRVFQQPPLFSTPISKHVYFVCFEHGDDFPQFGGSEVIVILL
jgi:hypothetical protein